MGSSRVDIEKEVVWCITNLYSLVGKKARELEALWDAVTCGVRLGAGLRAVRATEVR